MQRFCTVVKFFRNIFPFAVVKKEVWDNKQKTPKMVGIIFSCATGYLCNAVWFVLLVVHTT